MKVFIASTVDLAPNWQDLRTKWAPQIQINSRWIDIPDLVKKDLTRDPGLGQSWLEDEEDVFHSDALLCFAMYGQKLRGALVETGMAIAFRMPVICCGDSPLFGSWQFHPRCHRVQTLDDAHALLLKWTDEDEFPEI